MSMCRPAPHVAEVGDVSVKVKRVLREMFEAPAPSSEEQERPVEAPLDGKIQ